MYTSKNTSVNANRPAAAYNWAEKNGLLYNRTVLDYGCGKYFLNCYDAALAAGCKSWTGYDPYWKPQDLRYRTFDTIICANVLNVIKNERELDQCINRVLQMLAPLGVALFQIYEGDKSGIGTETKPDCWQRNQKAKFYADRIFLNPAFNPVGMTIFRSGKFIVVKDILPF